MLLTDFLLQVSPNLIVPQDTTLAHIMDNTMNTALNTKFGTIALISFVAAVISALSAFCSFFVGWKTMKAQLSTDDNTKGKKNIRSTQNLMVDMIRHFYWNYVISYAIAERMRKAHYKVYPSEEHLKKMAVHLDSIDLHIYLENSENYSTLSNLYLLLRNYNYELEVIGAHFRDSAIDDETKERDLKTLIFKCDFLTRKVVEALSLIWPDTGRSFFDEAREMILNTQGTRWSKRENKEIAEYSFTPYMGNDDTYYITELFRDSSDDFVTNFNRDVAVELGKNNVGGNKIHMIDLECN